MSEFGVPDISQVFLNNQDVFYDQFNDVKFYVEDINQENLYFRILKKKFPLIKIGKIFPLGGKKAVIKEAEESLGDRDKVFLLDLDFDEILEKRSDLNNIFYLERYSIENYLLEEFAINEIIKDEKPTLKDENIEQLFSFKSFLLEVKHVMGSIFKSFLVIQEYELGITNVDHDISFFCNINETPATNKRQICQSYNDSINIKLTAINPAYTVETCGAKFDIYFNSEDDILKYAPGKSLAKFLKNRIEHIFHLKSFDFASFVYRLSAYCKFESLNYLKIAIDGYLNS